jgi:DNA (cytosine-5)-methyltransferase 1
MTTSPTKLGVDLFCGAGGTSTGLLQAAANLGQRLSLLAVNHWNTAIDSHTRNHPHVRHLCESLDSVDPRKTIPGRLHILVASPECTHHSNARGGVPRSDQSRSSAWHVVRWAEAKQPDCILVENVREFQNWGPLNANGKPSKRHKGKTYTAFLNALRSLGYDVHGRVLNAADYGDATTRQRLFVMARRDRKVEWPEPSHAGRWRPAREIIDWSVKGQSIFARKRPLSPNTMRRIIAGLRRFGGESFVMHLTHQGGERVHSLDNPIPTITTAKRGELAMVEPFLIKYHGSHQGRVDGDKRFHSIEEPVPTLDTSNRIGLVEPFLVQLRGTEESHIENGARCLDEPIPALTAGGNHLALCEPFVIGQQSGAAARAVGQPLPTIATAGAIALIEPFLVKYYGKGANAHSIDEPLGTITTNDRFALIDGHSDGLRLDIRFRMLQPHELAAAMSFPSGYQFAGTRGCQVKQIGNAVPVRVATALCQELLTS